MTEVAVGLGTGERERPWDVWRDRTEFDVTTAGEQRTASRTVLAPFVVLLGAGMVASFLPARPGPDPSPVTARPVALRPRSNPWTAIRRSAARASDRMVGAGLLFDAIAAAGPGEVAAGFRLVYALR